MTELPMPSFPHLRMRRNRRTAWSRDLVRENSLQVSDLIWPLFVIEGKETTVPVPSMPGVERHTVDRLVRKAEQAAELGIPAIALFPNTPHRCAAPMPARPSIPTIWFARRCGPSRRPCLTSASCATWLSIPIQAMAMTA